MKNLSSLIAGIIFGLGLAISGMINPAKVIGFLDITGAWDPSLAFVMGGGVAVTLLANRYILKRPSPILAASFRMPAPGDIDGRLIGGSALFGVGWGLVGLCPGPAIASLAYGQNETLLFVIAALAGVVIADFWSQGPVTPASADT